MPRTCCFKALFSQSTSAAAETVKPYRRASVKPSQRPQIFGGATRRTLVVTYISLDHHPSIWSDLLPFPSSFHTTAIWDCQSGLPCFTAQGVCFRGGVSMGQQSGLAVPDGGRVWSLRPPSLHRNSCDPLSAESKPSSQNTPGAIALRLCTLVVDAPGCRLLSRPRVAFWCLAPTACGT